MLRLFILSLILVSSVALSAQEDIWLDYSPSETRYDFSVEVPDSVIMVVDTVATSAGDIVSERYFTRNPYDSTMYFMINAVHYPDSGLDEDTKMEIVESSIAEATQQTLGRIVYNEPLKNKGITGRYFKIAYVGDQRYIKGRMFFYQDALYGVQVSHDKEKNLSDSVDRFLDSFSILD